MPDTKDLFAYGPTIIILALLLWRGLPVWKDVRIRELDVRDAENKVRGQEALALQRLGDALEHVAIEQRKATEATEIIQKVNAEATERLTETVSSFAGQVEKLTETTASLSGRVDKLESVHAEIQRTRARPN